MIKVIVRVYYKDDVGKRKAITRTGIMSKAEARSVAKKLEADLKKTIMNHDVPTFYEYLQQYIDTYRIENGNVASIDIDKWIMKRLFSIVKIDEESNELFISASARSRRQIRSCTEQ